MLAVFVAEMMAEDKYGREYVSRIEQRVKSLNDPQLLQLLQVMEDERRNAKMHMWKEVHESVLVHAREEWRVRHEQHEIDRKQRELEAFLEHRRQQTKLATKHHRENMVSMMESKCRKQAEAEAEVLARKRHAEETVRFLKAVQAAEERRNKLWAYSFGILIVAIILATTVPFPIGLSIFGFLFLVACGLAHYAYKQSLVQRKVVPEEQIEDEVDTRTDELFNKAYNEFRRLEKKAKLRDKQDKATRKLRAEQRRKEREEKAKQEGEWEARLQEQRNKALALAAERDKRRRDSIRAVMDAETAAAAAAAASNEADGEKGVDEKSSTSSGEDRPEGTEGDAGGAKAGAETEGHATRGAEDGSETAQKNNTGDIVVQELQDEDDGAGLDGIGANDADRDTDEQTEQKEEEQWIDQIVQTAALTDGANVSEEPESKDMAHSDAHPPPESIPAYGNGDDEREQHRLQRQQEALPLDANGQQGGTGDIETGDTAHDDFADDKAADLVLRVHRIGLRDF